MPAKPVVKTMQAVGNCNIAVRYDRALDAVSGRGKMSDKDKLAIMEAAWIELRDAMETVKERINKEKVAPLIGNCYRYIHRHHDTRKIEQTGYYQVLRAEGYQTFFFHFTVSKAGGITIEPEHRGGIYICQHYEKISKNRFDRFFQAVLDDLKYHNEQRLA
jgi:hypothetical protein